MTVYLTATGILLVALFAVLRKRHRSLRRRLASLLRGIAAPSSLATPA
jgi:hypothetical protein